MDGAVSGQRRLAVVPDALPHVGRATRSGSAGAAPAELGRAARGGRAADRLAAASRASALGRRPARARAAACWRPAARSTTRWPPAATRCWSPRDCSVCITTLPARRCAARPDARVLWLDAHGDFNTPDTTPSGFLGGMCLAGACGLLGRRPRPPARRPGARRDVRRARPRRARARAAGDQRRRRDRRARADLADALRRRAGLRPPRPRRAGPDRSCPVAVTPPTAASRDGGLRMLLGEVAEAATSSAWRSPASSDPSLAKRMAAIVDAAACRTR